MVHLTLIRVRQGQYSKQLHCVKSITKSVNSILSKDEGLIKTWPKGYLNLCSKLMQGTQYRMSEQ